MTTETQTTMTQEEMLKMIEKLKAENAALAVKALNAPKVSLKVSEKGAISLYGMGKFPVTLYAEQWLQIGTMKDEISAFIDANRSRLPTKAESKAKAAEAKAAQEDAERKARVESALNGGTAHRVG